MSENAEHLSRALDTFLAGQERRAYRMAYLATSRQDDALDIVQDAMLKLVRRYAKRDATEWPALFTRILQNAITDWHRRETVRRRWRQWFSRNEDEEQQEDALEQVAQPGTHQPQDRVMQDGAMRKLDEVLRKLPVRQQQVFLLRQWEGLDVAQTADAMGISQGSVKTHYSRAVHRLREELEEHWQ